MVNEFPTQLFTFPLQTSAAREFCYRFFVYELDRFRGPNNRLCIYLLENYTVDWLRISDSRLGDRILTMMLSDGELKAIIRARRSVNNNGG